MFWKVNNLIKTINRSVVLKDCDFSFDWSKEYPPSLKIYVQSHAEGCTALFSVSNVSNFLLKKTQLSQNSLDREI